MHIKGFGLILGLFLLLACDAVAVDVPVQGEGRADAALERAMEHYRAGKLNEAAGLLRGFLVSHKESPLIDTAYLRLAQIHAQLGDAQPALGYLLQIPPHAQTPTSHLLEGRLLVQTGDPATALDGLLEIDPSALVFSEQQARWLVMAEAALMLEQPQRALYFLSRALLLEGEETPIEVLARGRTVMDDSFSPDDLNEAAFMYAETPIGYLAMLQLAWRALSESREQEARELTTAVLRGPPGFAYHEEALTLLAQVTDPGQLQRAIGVVLPLSGRYAAFGELVQRGMELAQSSFRPNVPVRFIYRDTAADAGQSAHQVAELAISERVMAIIGPLVGNAAAAAAERANREQVPILTLSQKYGLPASGPFVFRNSLTGLLQAQALADYAMNQQGLTQFAILHPRSRQGELLADQFRDEVERRGGELVVRESYAAEQTDFRRQVRLLRGLDPDAPDEEDAPVEGEAEVQEEPPPFEALFIPDYAERVGLLAPQLAFYGLEGVQLLGSNGWNDPELVKVAGQYVENAVFVDGFFSHSHYPFVRDFTERYFTAYGSEPTILEAQGYDAAGILLSLLNRPEIQSRDALRRGLLELDSYPGVTGATRFNFLGEAEKLLFLLQVQDGNILQIN
jgi:ABC-type branched-subunit amino acid transport system substrate-binding protein